MPDAQFKLMRDILAAPSPVGLEGAMTYGVLKPYFESFAPSDWQLHQFRGNAGLCSIRIQAATTCSRS